MKTSPDKALRQHLLYLLKEGGAHATFEDAIKGFPAKLRSQKVPNFPHSAWMLVEHMRIAQRDILEFSRNPKHVSPKWPEGYWPKTETPPSAGAWTKSIASFRKGSEVLLPLAESSVSVQPSAMKDRQEWLRELDLRQRNVDPIGRIPNVALFQGALIKGSRRLNGPQRVAAVVFGCCGLFFGCFTVALVVGGLMGDASGMELLYRLSYLPFGMLSFYFGFRIVINAVVNEPAKQPSGHVDSPVRH